VRLGRWSLHLAPTSPTWGSSPDAAPPVGGTARLFDLDADPSEHSDVASAHPAVVTELRELLLRRLASSAKQRSALGVDGLDGLDAGAATIQMLEDIGYL